MSEIIVRVRYFNILVAYAGTRQAEIRIAAGTTVRKLLESLIDGNPGVLRDAMMRGDALNSYLRVFRNNDLIDDKALDTPLTEGDEILLFPAVAGGECLDYRARDGYVSHG